MATKRLLTDETGQRIAGALEEIALGGQQLKVVMTLGGFVKSEKSHNSPRYFLLVVYPEGKGMGSDSIPFCHRMISFQQPP